MLAAPHFGRENRLVACVGKDRSAGNAWTAANEAARNFEPASEASSETAFANHADPDDLVADDAMPDSISLSEADDLVADYDVMSGSPSLLELDELEARDAVVPGWFPPFGLGSI